MSQAPRNPEEVSHHLERADEFLAAVGELLEKGHHNAAASRAYYAAFHAAKAALLRAGIDRSKHGGVIGAVHEHFVKPGRLPVAAGRALQRLFALRTEGDYGTSEHVLPHEAKEALELAGGFVKQVQSMLKEEVE